jgi:hypothetical protein
LWQEAGNDLCGYYVCEFIYNTTDLARLPHWLPWRLSGWLISAAVAFSRGTPWRFGLPRPEQPLLASHPTISEEIFLRLGSGDVIPRPGIDRLEGDDVRFVDGTREAVDVIIWCTGYRVSFPFFDPGFISAPGNDLPLWERLIHPDVPALYFAGLLQPLGAVMPLAEAQGRFIAEHLAGRIRLPSPETMRADMDRERRASRRRYRDGAERHTMQVDFAEYLHRLQRQSLAGRRRAVSRAGPSPDGTAAGSEPSLPADDPR